MKILARALRICKADLHGVLDKLDDRGLLLKQYLRDMEAVLEKKETALVSMNRSHAQIQRECQKNAREHGDLERDIASALRQGKDDVARRLIRKLKSLGRLRGDIGKHLSDLNQEILRFKTGIDHQRLQYGQLKQRVREYFQRIEHEKWERTLPVSACETVRQEVTAEEVERELLHRKKALSQ